MIQLVLYIFILRVKLVFFRVLGLVQILILCHVRFLPPLYLRIFLRSWGPPVRAVRLYAAGRVVALAICPFTARRPAVRQLGKGVVAGEVAAVGVGGQGRVARGGGRCGGAAAQGGLQPLGGAHGSGPGGGLGRGGGQRRAACGRRRAGGQRLPQLHRGLVAGRDLQIGGETAAAQVQQARQLLAVVLAQVQRHQAGALVPA